VEDADSLERKMEILRQFDIAGIAEWKLGFETEDIWEVLRQGLS
jgi:spore germination protein YaaH